MNHPWKGLEKLPRDVWILSVTIFINRAGTMVLPFLVIYLTKNFGYTPARAGVVLAVYGFAALCSAPFAGKLSDRYGALVIMKASLFLSGLMFFVYPFLSTFESIIAATVVLAVVNEMFRPASLAMIGGLVLPENKKAAFALARLAINLGMSIGPATAGFLATMSFWYLFMVDAVTSILAGIALILFFLHQEKKVTSGRHSRHDSAPFAFRDMALLYFFIAVIPIAMVFFQHEAAMPLYMIDDLGLKASHYGLMFTINTIIIVLLEVPINLATSHWSHRRTLAVGSLLCSLGFGLMAFSFNLWHIIATVVIWTFGEMILFPGMTGYVSHIAPHHRQGEYMGFYTMAFGIAFTLGPWLGTRVLQIYGGYTLWIATFLCGSITTLMFLKVRESARAAARDSAAVKVSASSP